MTGAAVHVNIQVKQLADKEPLMSTFQVSDTIADIKMMVQESWGIPPIAQKLIHGRKELCIEEASIQEYGLSEGAVLLMLVVNQPERPDQIVIEIDFMFPSDRMSDEFEEELHKRGIREEDLERDPATQNDHDGFELAVVLNTGEVLDHSATEQLMERGDNGTIGDDLPVGARLRVTAKVRKPTPSSEAIAKALEPTMRPKCSSGVVGKQPSNLLKMVIVGDAGVGKSNFVLRFAQDTFEPSYITTIGVDYKIKTTTVGTESVQLQLWDTAGQERFRVITHAYLQTAQAFFCMYDVCDRDSFDNVDYWLSEISHRGMENAPKLLVGNKCDMESSREVSTDEGRKKAQELGIAFIETSAKEANHVEDAVMAMVTELLGKEKQ